MKRRSLWVVIFLTLVGCSTVVLDPSMPAVDANDYTLVLTACSAVPGRGMDVCMVRENTVIDSEWRMVVPMSGAQVLGGEIDVYYRDLHKSYAVTGNVVSVPWKDFFGSEKWTRDMDGEALALLQIRYRTPQGVEEIARFRGIAKLVVTREGYDRLPIDSGYVSWGATCKVQYTTAGRSALQCK